MKNKIVKIIILLVIGFFILAVGYFAGEQIGFNKGYDNGFNAGYQQGFDTLKAATYLDPADAVANPIENMPTANPFEESVNPFE
ncbi:hypothetical protein AMJ47_04040 [Parcubacteria bacterium DG_72]|nr:MAG: hypothetical protein AMJ47_04040 [Parcubacteria bacterium DG_72]